MRQHTTPHRIPRSRPGGRGLVALGAAMALGLGPLLGVGGAHAEEHTVDRGLDEACTDYAQDLPVSRFVDLNGGVHEDAINCIGHWDIAHGREAPDVDTQRVYAPRDTVTRDAMASFIARTMMRVPTFDFPERTSDDPSAFDDIDGSAHERNVNLLADVEVVRGREDGDYHPRSVVTRDAMASFIARAIERVTGEEIPTGDDHAPAFGDTDGSVHEEAIDKLATIGVVQGREDGTYGPAEPVTRDAMASFIARSMDYLAVMGHWPVPYELDVELSRDAAPANLNHRLFLDVINQFGMGYYSADVRLEVHREHGDGHELVHAAHGVSAPDGSLRFSYNAQADPGDVDEVVACVVDPADEPAPSEAHCAEHEDGDVVPSTERSATVTTTWSDPADVEAVVDDGSWVGELIRHDADGPLFDLQTMPASADGDEQLVRVPYDEDATFHANGEHDIGIERWQCAAEASVDQGDVDHRLQVLLDQQPQTIELVNDADLDHCA